jgi:organic radical activating enzyme
MNIPHKDGLNLPVTEEFYSLQGEGYYTGTAAYFVRLAGCDVGCHWCDSKPSWDVQTEQLVPVNDIIARAVKNPSRHFVLTGGEPFNYNLEPLSSKLKGKDIITHIETSGTAEYSGVWNWICLSPKPWHPPIPYFFQKANELKIIIQTINDFKWANACIKNVSPQCILFLQPEWSVFNNIVPVIVEYIKQHPQWRMSLQAHKFMKIP